MNNKNRGRWAGFFLLLMVAAGIPGVLYRGIGSAILDNPEMLDVLLTSTAEMRMAIMLDFFAGIFGLVFTVMVFNVLKPHSPLLSFIYLGLWIFQVGIAIIGDVCHYALLETAQFASENGIGELSLTGVALVKGYIGAHFISLITYSGTFAFLHALLLKFRILPAWLAIWGMIAPGIVFTVTWFQIFDHSVNFHFYNQNGLFMLVLTIYLIIKGFNEDKPNE